MCNLLSVTAFWYHPLSKRSHIHTHRFKNAHKHTHANIDTFLRVYSQSQGGVTCRWGAQTVIHFTDICIHKSRVLCLLSFSLWRVTKLLLTCSFSCHHTPINTQNHSIPLFSLSLFLPLYLFSPLSLSPPSLSIYLFPPLSLSIYLCLTFSLSFSLSLFLPSGHAL